jgi:hypothetical protein
VSELTRQGISLSAVDAFQDAVGNLRRRQESYVLRQHPAFNLIAVNVIEMPLAYPAFT